MIKTQSKLNPPLTKQCYPYIGIEDVTGTIVLFTENKTGTVLSSSNCDYNIGEFKNVWNMQEFRPLARGEQVIMENE